MLGGIGMQELLVIFFIVLIIFGAKKLPEIGAGLGKGIRNFKKAVQEPVDTLPSSEEQQNSKLSSSQSSSVENSNKEKN